MKKEKLELGKKLFLNKEKISQLSKEQSANVVGGGNTCPSNCVLCYDTKDPDKCQTQGDRCESCDPGGCIITDPSRAGCDSRTEECQTLDINDLLCASIYLPGCDTHQLC